VILIVVMMMMMMMMTTTMMMGCGLNSPNAMLNGRIGSVETLLLTAGNLASTCRQSPLMKLSWMVDWEGRRDGTFQGNIRI